jgi:hypothetical protein
MPTLAFPNDIRPRGSTCPTTKKEKHMTTIFKTKNSGHKRGQEYCGLRTLHKKNKRSLTTERQHSFVRLVTRCFTLFENSREPLGNTKITSVSKNVARTNSANAKYHSRVFFFRKSDTSEICEKLQGSST